MEILLTFTGFHDPYTKGLVGNEEQTGPILSLLNVKSFDRIILFFTPNTEKYDIATQKAIASLYPTIEIETKYMPLEDPTNYMAILRGLRVQIRDICSTHKKAKYFISVASGTPQMHACWILLASSGEIPAHILHVRPHRFVSRHTPMVSEVDFTQPEFPIVRANIARLEEEISAVSEYKEVIKQLGIVGDHPAMQKALEEGAVLAASSVPVLILGETGTGKELFAHFIHRLSDRVSGPFVPVNCGAIPEGLTDSFLFGHKKGAFTGAVRDHAGKFDQADSGTLFLDEVGELPVSTQARLLRVLQDGMVEPVGAQKPHRVDVRIISATNKDLVKSVKRGKFREDLYYRLNVGQVYLPPLRQRRTDIPQIALHVLDRVNASLKRWKRLSPGALVHLQNAPWPGNVRELENVIERSVLRARKDVIEKEDLMIQETPFALHSTVDLPELSQGFSLNGYIITIRERIISKALVLAEGNRSEAARLLGISPQAVHKYLRNRDTISTMVE
ncbi:MAG: sigma-54 dependent transcriptional regulator [Pseudomonadota bacterium]